MHQLELQIKYRPRGVKVESWCSCGEFWFLERSYEAGDRSHLVRRAMRQGDRHLEEAGAPPF